MILKVLLFIFIIKISHSSSSSSHDPYKTIGVSSSASVTEIKRAYKLLARQLHPDKNKAKDAEKKFIELNKAYELLMDPERREQYDKHGITEDTPNFRSRPDYSTFKRFDFDPFESLFSGHSSDGTQFDYGHLYRKLMITSRAYENNIIPSSSIRPYMIVFYGDLCFPCLQVEPLWQKIMNELEPLGVGFATIHSQHESKLAQKIGVHTLPYIMSVIDGDVKQYKDEHITLLKIIDFIRRSLPSDLIAEVDDETYEEFLLGWNDNRVRTLFINDDNLIRLRYLLVAYQFRDRIAFAHVTADETAEAITERYRVDPKLESMLVFNEDVSRTTVMLSLSELKPQLMRDVLESNKFLLLPRLASQLMFDQLCPPESVHSRRRLCVVLITNVHSHESARDAMRQYIRENHFAKERLRFMYLYEEKQQEFVKALSVGADTPQTKTLHVVVLWRRESDRVLYEWLPKEWNITDYEQMNETKESLTSLLNKLIQNTEKFSNDVRVVSLIDEHARGIFGKIVKKILIMSDNISDNITRKDVLPVISVAMSIGFIVFIGYIMAYFVRIEEESIRERYRKMGKRPPGTAKPKGETYNGLVRLLKPGCRTIVLICDAASKPKLLPQFYRAVYPYRKNKTLMFSFLLIEKNLEWYRKILMQTLGEHSELHINPKNSIGTVVSLNGFRKYFCLYHAKHPEMRPQNNRRHRYRDSSGSFMGFDDESNDSDGSDVESGNLIHHPGTIDDDIVFEEHLLDELSHWLDRLFEGSTQRYHIQYWPEHMK